MYRNTRFASPRHNLFCGLLVYRLDKLTLDKIDLKKKNKKKVFDVSMISSNIWYYIMDNFYPSFLFWILVIAQNCIVSNLIINVLSSIAPFLNLAYSSPGLMALFIKRPRLDEKRIHRGLPSGVRQRPACLNVRREGQFWI